MALRPSRPRRDPFRDLMEFARMPWAMGEQQDGEWVPVVDITEEDDAMSIKAELPGMKKDDVKVSIEKDALILQGERKSESKKEDTNYYVCERSYGTFYRRLPLPKPVNADKAEAKFEDGVLSIKAPLAEPEKPRGVSVPIK